MMRTILICALVLMLIFSISSRFSDAKVIGAWLFDEGEGDAARDSSRNGIDGVLTGGPEWVDGKFGKALKCTDSKYIDFPPPTSELLMIKKELSFMAWVRPDEFRSAWNIVFSMQRGSSNGEAYSLALGSSSKPGYIMAFVNADSNVRVDDPQPIQTGEWVHAAATYDGSKLALYRNGEPVAEVAVTGDLNHEDRKGRFVINGNYNSLDGGLQEWVRATIDEVLIFDEVLTADQVKAYMEKGFNDIAAVDAADKLTTKWGELKASK